MFGQYVYSTFSHNLFVRNRKLKTASYVMVGKLWGPTLISENWSHFCWFCSVFGVEKTFSYIFIHEWWKKTNKRLKLSEKQWIYQTKTDHSELSNAKIAQNLLQEFGITIRKEFIRQNLSQEDLWSFLAKIHVLWRLLLLNWT